MVDLTLTLSYALAPGWLAPFTDALIRGEALARRCTACNRTSFPPLRICSCGSADGTWAALDGTADIILRTTGSDGDFALVRFHGADTNCTVRLADMPADTRQGALARPDDGSPDGAPPNDGRPAFILRPLDLHAPRSPQ